MSTDVGKHPTAAAPSRLLTEVPSSLKQLVRLVARGFYVIEDSLIVDMLVRYPCLREEDLAELLKFDRKMLRSKINSLKNDKIVQIKQRIETDAEGKVSRMNCYFINYKVFVSVVKYKLDHMQKKMETNERDATARSSFKCKGCMKTFTDLEADQLFDPLSMEFRCTFCSSIVEEDEAAGPQTDSRQLIARFNDQMEKLYELLRAVENVTLAPGLLEPEPIDIKMNATDRVDGAGGASMPDGGGRWTGEATRNMGLKAEDQQVNITFGESAVKSEAKRELPIWMQESTVTSEDRTNQSLFGIDEDSNSMMAGDSLDASNSKGFNSTSFLDEDTTTNITTAEDIEQSDEITSLLLKHEKKSQGSQNPMIPKDSDSDNSVDSDAGADQSTNMTGNLKGLDIGDTGNIEEMDNESDDDGDIPTVKVGDEEITVTDVTPDIIAKMTTEEKERYTQIFQDFYSHMYE